MTAESRVAFGVVGAVVLVAVTLYGLQNWTFVGSSTPMATPPKVVVAKRDPAPPAATSGRSSAAPPERPRGGQAQAAAQPAWSSLGPTGLLQRLYDESLRSANPEVRAIGAVVAGMCQTLATDTSTAGASSLAAQVRFANDPRADMARVAVQAQSAHAEFTRVCRTGDTAAFLAANEQAPVAMQSASMRLSVSPAGSPDFRQAARQVLAAPADHPLGVDRWLEKEVPARLEGGPPLSPLQLRLVRDEAYRALTGDRNEASLPRLFRCATARLCAESFAVLSPPERAAAMQAAQGLEQAVRQGRWAALGLQP
ncbi:MAG: hypothetical protein ACKO5J_00930 [Rubrivivax sp.]